MLWSTCRRTSAWSRTRASGSILADASDAFILHHPLQEGGVQTRDPVGYLASGKARWRRGGKIYVQLDGATRTYSAAQSFDYPRPKKRGRKYE